MKLLYREIRIRIVFLQLLLQKQHIRTYHPLTSSYIHNYSADYYTYICRIINIAISYPCTLFIS